MLWNRRHPAFSVFYFDITVLAGRVWIRLLEKHALLITALFIATGSAKRIDAPSHMPLLRCKSPYPLCKVDASLKITVFIMLVSGAQSYC